MSADGSVVVACTSITDSETGTTSGEVAWIGSDGVIRGVANLECGVKRLVVAPSGNVVVAGTQQGDVVWIGNDGVTRGQVANINMGEISHLVMAPDGSAVVAGTKEGDVAWIGSDGVTRGEVTKLKVSEAAAKKM